MENAVTFPHSVASLIFFPHYLFGRASDLLLFPGLIWAGKRNWREMAGDERTRRKQPDSDGDEWMDSELETFFQLLQEGGPLPGPESGLLSNTRKWIVRGDTRADKARDFIGKGRPGREQEGKGTQKHCSATWLAVSGFMVMGLVSRLSLANHSDSGSFLVAHAWFSQDGFQPEGFWEVGRTYGHMASPLLLTFPEFFRLMVSC